MIYAYNKKLKNTAQKLRREMTAEEKHLWYDFLKHLAITVNRQKNIGNYIVDFLSQVSELSSKLTDGNMVNPNKENTTNNGMTISKGWASRFYAIPTRM